MFTDIITNWEDGLISTSEALMQIMSHPSAPDGYMLGAIANITLKLHEQEQFEAEQADAEAQHELSILKHGPHGKRCYCDECSNPDDYEPDALAEESEMLKDGYQTAHVVEFIKYYGL
jgi:hypothetical protein